jgi:hypothetical protein
MRSLYGHCSGRNEPRNHALHHLISSFRGAPSSGANPESSGVVRYHIEIPGSPLRGAPE